MKSIKILPKNMVFLIKFFLAPFKALLTVKQQTGKEGTFLFSINIVEKLFLLFF